jgi:hypothetical protein
MTIVKRFCSLTQVLFLALSFPVFAQDGQPVFRKDPKVLVPVVAKIDCSQVASIKKNLGDDSDRKFLGSKQNGTFVVWNSTTRTVDGCDQGKAFSVKFDLPASEGEEIHFEGDSLRDITGSGKLEFVLFNGQCVEGPCLGDRHLYQLEMGKVRKLFVLNGDLIEVLTGDTHPAIKVEKLCFTYEFGIAFSTFDIIEFATPNEPILVPGSEVHKRYPKVLEAYSAHLKPLTAAEKKEMSSVEQNYREIEKIVARAYDGASLSSLEKEYKSLKWEGEDHSPPVHCDPWALIMSVASASGAKSKVSH